MQAPSYFSRFRGFFLPEAPAQRSASEVRNSDRTPTEKRLNNDRTPIEQRWNSCLILPEESSGKHKKRVLRTGVIPTHNTLYVSAHPLDGLILLSASAFLGVLPSPDWREASSEAQDPHRPVLQLLLPAPQAQLLPLRLL